MATKKDKANTEQQSKQAQPDGGRAVGAAPDNAAPAPDEVREEAVAVYLGEKDAEDASEEALAELAHPSEVRAAEAGLPPVPGVRPGVTLPESESSPQTPTTWDEQQIAEFQQKHRQPAQEEKK